MTIWELRCANVNDYSLTVPLDRNDMSDRLFDVKGEPMSWGKVPRIGFADSSRKKHKRPPADVSAMLYGALVLNTHAYEVLGPFLSRFGQLLELRSETGLDPRHYYNEAKPSTWYFYNVTHLVPCVDLERSERNDLGQIRQEVFDTSSVPTDAAVFKDPATARSRIYVNDAGKALIDGLVASAGLSGVECAPPEPRL